MVSIFEFNSYRDFILTSFEKSPKKGRGLSRRLAMAMSVHTTFVSQVLKGHKSFNSEQALQVADFLNLNELETEFFLLLVQWDRAGTQQLKQHLRKRIHQLQEKSRDLQHRLKAEKKLSEEERAVFYSDWVYSAVRQMTALPGSRDIAEIALALGLAKKRVREIVDFLLKSGLCIENKGRLEIGPRSTFIESSSPWIRMHHANWRHRAVDAVMNDEKDKLHFTHPMTLSKEDAAHIREMIVKFLESVDKVVDPSPSEEVRCLNIDWFRVV